MNTHVYKIVTGGSGSFLAPPGHPGHGVHLDILESPRHRNPFFSGSIEHALHPDFDGPPHIVDQARALMAKIPDTENELWVRSVYAHFRNCYTPETGSRSASDQIIHNRPEIAAKRAATVLDTIHTALKERAKQRATVAEEGGSVPKDTRLANITNYRRGVAMLYGRRRGWEITATPDGTAVYIYALADDGTRYSAQHLDDFAEALDRDDEFTDVHREQHPEDNILDRIKATVVHPPLAMDPERHTAVAMIRDYYPLHRPRLDLIDNPRPTTGPCLKCGQKVQYEGKLDKLAIVSTRMTVHGMTIWDYKTDCANGGDHAI
jgi:hypothetical protein